MTNLQTSEVHSRTLTAFFDTREAADKAVGDLVAEGIPREHIKVSGDGTARTAAATPDHDKGFWDSLKDMFLPDEDRSAYVEGLRRGGFLLSVQADEANYTRVLEIVDQDGAVDLDQRETAWRQEGWTGFAASSTATGNATTTTAAVSGQTAAQPRNVDAAVGQDEVIPVYEEQLRVGKRDINQGRVRVRSYVVETPVTDQVSLRNERVQVERTPVDRVVGAADAVFQDRVIEAEEHAEEAVIAKEVRLKEEVTLRKTAEQRSQTVSDMVRRTEVDVQDERGVSQGGTAPRVVGAAATSIVEHMDVIASDGTKIGTVDHLDGPDRIKLAKNTAPDGQHHFVPLTWVDHVDSHVHLNKTSSEAKAGW